MLPRRRGQADEEEEEEEEASRSSASESNKWAETVHGNQIAGMPFHLHQVHHSSSGRGHLSAKKSDGRRHARRSCSGTTTWLLLLFLHDLGLVCLCLWISNRQDSKKIPWKWLGFADDD